MLARILPEVVTLVLWAGLAIGSAVYLGALDSAVSGWQKLWKSLGIMLLAWGVFLLIAVASGGKSALHPLAHIVSAVPTTGVSSAGTAHSGFKKVNTIAELNQALASAKAEHKAVMLDFYADWCVSCKEMEAFTFTDPVVAEQMAQLVVLQVDVTENTDDHKALMKQFGVVGPPAILFFDATSTELRHARVVGFMKAPAFAERLQKALGR
jgi:thiol:disulfide interchange protein DsbD